MRIGDLNLFNNASSSGGGGTGLTWSLITSSLTASANNGYIATGGGALSVQLPASGDVGDSVALVLNGATSWTITQTAGVQIRFGSQTTTAGAGGSLASSAQGDSVTLVRQSNTVWVVTQSVGNITIV